MMILKKIILSVAFIGFPVLALAEAPILKSMEEFESDSQKICYSDWNKRGETNQRMYDFCMKEKMSGYEKLKSLHQYANKDFYSKVSYPYCFNLWTKRGVSDAQMMAHCLDQEIEGVKDILYYQEKYGKDSVNEITNLALAKFKCWHMAAYEVKRHFES
ncbi:hypothetical protein [Pseudomonas migulae]|uniref:Uncharacterized protein n=1 Tax=Pseudomonas migulae TaxID=78543 RepID=A0A1H5NGU1_9PSED|nr:hypothetical protein [Pseudomonas migulae]SEF00795.1 hypothetical protein SAMN04490194_6061 [Pseudomonas migulae]